MLLLTILWTLQEPTAPKREDAASLITATRSVVSALRQAAEANQRRASPRRGEALTAEYVQAAARAARLHSPALAGKAFLLGLGVGLDHSRLARDNLLLASTWKQIESESERKERLAVLGQPHVHGRYDLIQHFAVSAALTALYGEKFAETTGLAKELLDSAEGGSGFSFADLGANYAGIALARRILKDPAFLATLEKGFRPADYVLSPAGLVEGLTRKQFEARYGNFADARFRKAREALLRSLAELPGYQE